MSMDWRENEIVLRHRKIFEEELDSFLPDRIVDSHVHVFPDGTSPNGTVDCGGNEIGKYSFDDFLLDCKALLPGRKAGALCMGFPDAAFDAKRNNSFAADNARDARCRALRLFDPSEEPEATIKDLESGRFAGVKPYPCYVKGKSQSEVEVCDMLPSWIMEELERLELVAVLHLPRAGRLADPANLEGLERLCKSFPRSKIILAHVGRAYFLKCALGNVERLAKLPNLWFDLAMLNNADVLEHAFKSVPREKILFGSDAPIAFALGKSVEANDQYAYLTPRRWALSIHDATGRIAYASFLYEELRAIRTASKRLALKDAFLEAIFHDNAAKLLNLEV